MWKTHVWAHNGKGPPLREPEEAGLPARTSEGKYGESLSSFRFTFVPHTLESGFPSVPLSPWPVSGSPVRLSHLSSYCGTGPRRPRHRPQRAEPHHQSHRWAARTTGTSLTMAWDLNSSDKNCYAGNCQMMTAEQIRNLRALFNLLTGYFQEKEILTTVKVKGWE